MLATVLTHDRLAAIVEEVEALREAFHTALDGGYSGAVVPLIDAQVRLFRFFAEENLWSTSAT